MDKLYLAFFGAGSPSVRCAFSSLKEVSCLRLELSFSSLKEVSGLLLFRPISPLERVSRCEKVLRGDVGSTPRVGVLPGVTGGDGVRVLERDRERVGDPILVLIVSGRFFRRGNAAGDATASLIGLNSFNLVGHLVFRFQIFSDFFQLAASCHYQV